MPKQPALPHARRPLNPVRAERIREPFGSEFDWKVRECLAMTSRCARVKARITPEAGGDYRLEIDFGRFRSPEDAREMAHLLLLVALDPDGFALNFEDFDFSILNRIGGGKMRADAAAARKGVLPEDVDIFDDEAEGG